MSDPNDIPCLEASLHVAMSPLQKGGDTQPFGGALGTIIPSDRTFSGARITAGQQVILKCRGYTKNADLPRSFLVHLALTSGLLHEGEHLVARTGGLTDILMHYDLGCGKKSDGSEFIGGKYLETLTNAQRKGRLTITKALGGSLELVAKWRATHARDMLVRHPQSMRGTTLTDDGRFSVKSMDESFVIDYEVEAA
jgi:hypothetical protein